MFQEHFWVIFLQIAYLLQREGLKRRPSKKTLLPSFWTSWWITLRSSPIDRLLDESVHENKRSETVAMETNLPCAVCERERAMFCEHSPRAAWVHTAERCDGMPWVPRPALPYVDNVTARNGNVALFTIRSTCGTCKIHQLLRWYSLTSAFPCEKYICSMNTSI